MKWEVRKRLEEIENRLYWIGYFGRKDLVRTFGVSEQQASTDIANYLKQAGNTVKYNRSTKRYEIQPDFKPELLHPSVESFFLWNQQQNDFPLIHLPTPERQIKIEAIRPIVSAVFSQKSVDIWYRSMSRPDPSHRRISPHSFAYDSYRHHVRAWCHQREKFLDFALGRILKTGEFGETGNTMKEDQEWNTQIMVRIGPCPGLNENQKKIIEFDYGMQNGELHIPVKMCLLVYFLSHFRIDSEQSENSRYPTQQQIILLNPEIRGYLR